MKKRFIDANIWEKSWFRKLTPPEKALFIYIFTRCDNAGVWDVDLEAAEFYIGEKINVDGFFKKVNYEIDKLNIVELSNSKWLLPEFVYFQWGVLNDTSTPHISYRKLLIKHGLIQDTKGMVALSMPLKKPLKRAKEKDIDKEKDKEIILRENEVIIVGFRKWLKKIHPNIEKNLTQKNILAWNSAINNLMKKGYSLEQIKIALGAAMADPFWRKTVQSVSYLEKKNKEGNLYIAVFLDLVKNNKSKIEQAADEFIEGGGDD